MQLEDLRKCYDDEEIDAVLKCIPSDIEDVYLRKLQNVAAKDVRRVSHIFYWISVAVRHLTTSELAAAPGVNLPGPKELLSICPSNMIRLETQTPSDANKLELLWQAPQKPSGTEIEIVKFDHPSVKRFLCSRKLQHSSDDQMVPFLCLRRRSMLSSRV